MKIFLSLPFAKKLKIMSRKIFSLLILALGFVALLSSCGGTSSGKTNYVSMYALVNGSNWRSAEPTAIVSDHKIKINGTSANGQTIIITLNDAQLGEYTFSSTNGSYAEFIPNLVSGTDRFSTLTTESGSGFVRLSSLNEETMTLGGEFYFKAFKADGSERSVTEGKFTNVPFTHYNLTEDDYTNVFKFTYNGQEWNAKDISATKTDTAMVVKGDCDRNDAWQGITLQMPPDITAGVHYFGADVSGVFQSGFYSFPATAGAVTITENNSLSKVIKGTFFFNYRDNNNAVQSVSEGFFDIKFTDETVVE